MVDAVPSRHSDAIELCVAADDRPGLLASIAAALAANRLDILTAHIFVRPLVSGGRVSDVPREKISGGSGIWMGVKDCFIHWWLLLRSAVIGMYIGILPALGPTIADWVAYGHAVQSAKDKSQFGKGDVRGVIAPETANNSVKGGDLVPTVAFGIPGSAAMAILLGAFLIQGLPS